MKDPPGADFATLFPLPFMQSPEAFVEAVREREASAAQRYRESSPEKRPAVRPNPTAATRAPRLSPVQPLPGHPPALVRPVAVDMARFYSRSEDRAFDAQTKTVVFDHRPVATLDASSFTTTMPSGSLTLPGIDVIASRHALFGGMPSHRLLRWEILTVHDRFEAGHPDARVLTVEGGYPELARELRLSSKYQGELRELLHAQSRWVFTLPDGTTGNLITYDFRDAHRGRRSRLRITVGPQLAPFYVDALPKNADRKLVPVLRSDPPFHGAPMFRGAQLTMVMAFLLELRARARELASEGSVRLTDLEWLTLGDRAGIPRKRAMPLAVRTAWLEGSTRVMPLIECVGPDRYTLASTYEREREFLVSGGRVELERQQDGRRSRRARVGQR